MASPEILFADESLVVALKPVGASSEGGENSMPVLLSAEFGTVYCVHRLDTAVGGVIVYARTKAAAQSLCEQIRSGIFQKEYRAVVAGKPEAEEGTLCDFLYHDRLKNKTFAVKSGRTGAKEAILDYKVTSSFSYEGTACSAVKIRLRTGRTHQIRVQFASRGLPLVGDGKYGSRIKGKIALFCERLTFFHPLTGKMLTFSGRLPADFPGESHRETERKYLIQMPDTDELIRKDGTEVWDISQTYLLSIPGVTRRVRKIVSRGITSYFYTEKRRLTNETAEEYEKTIGEDEYATLIEERDPLLNTVEKTRYRVFWNGTVYEIDVYPFWRNTAVLETEYETGKDIPTIPPFLQVIRDVTDDARYKNVRLACAVPEEERN